jgi:hypothetical protein
VTKPLRNMTRDPVRRERSITLTVIRELGTRLALRNTVNDTHLKPNKIQQRAQ